MRDDLKNGIRDEGPQETRLAREIEQRKQHGGHLLQKGCVLCPRHSKNREMTPTLLSGLTFLYPEVHVLLAGGRQFGHLLQLVT
jgi:hypothetical protein